MSKNTRFKRRDYEQARLISDQEYFKSGRPYVQVKDFHDLDTGEIRIYYKIQKELFYRLIQPGRKK
jgi:hypothetical protein